MNSNDDVRSAIRPAADNQTITGGLQKLQQSEETTSSLRKAINQLRIENSLELEAACRRDVSKEDP
jgi:hypothetical protein